MSFDKWGASMDLPVTATEEEIREAFSYMFSHLSMRILSKGGPGGEWDDRYVHAIPTEMKIKVYKENLDRKISIFCISDEYFSSIFADGTKE